MRSAPSKDQRALAGMNDDGGVKGSPLAEGAISPATAPQLPPAADPVYESLWHFSDQTSVCGPTPPPTLDQESRVYEQLWQFDTRKLLASGIKKRRPVVHELTSTQTNSIPLPDIRQETTDESAQDKSMLQRLKDFFRKETDALIAAKE